jgi:hypothetical protein
VDGFMPAKRENKFRVGKLFPESVFRAPNPPAGPKFLFLLDHSLINEISPQDGPGMFIAMRVPTF